MSKTLDANPGFENLTRHALSLKHVLKPVININCIGCLVRQGYHASRGVTLACVVLITRSGDVYSLSSPWGRARISIEMRGVIDVLQSIYKRHGRVFSDRPLIHRVGLVILTNEALNVNDQLGTSFPAVV